MDLLTLGARVKGTFRIATEEDAPEFWVDALSFKTTSDQEEETYAWLGRGMPMEQWESGPRPITRPGEFSLKVPNEDYANAVEVPAKTYRRRKFGEIDRVIRDLAVMGRIHPNEKMSALIRDGETELCYDQQFYYDTDHVSGKSGVQSNIVVASEAAGAVTDRTAPTAQEIKTFIYKAIARNMSFKDDQARPMNRGRARYFVMVPTPIMPEADAAIHSQVIVTSGASATNELAAQRNFELILVVNPDLDASWGSGDKKFAIFRADGSGAAFILQEEVPLYLDMGGVNNYELFHNKRLVFGTQRSYNVRPGHWQKSVLVKFAA